MPRNIKVTEPQTLADALLAWGDPEAVAEMTHLAQEGYNGPRLVILGGPETTSERNVSRYQSLRAQLESALIEKLREGSLTATGYSSRAAIDAAPVTIPADRWRVLTPNFMDSTAAAPGLTISGILVSEGEPFAIQEPRSGHHRLQISSRTRRVTFDNTELSLTPRSFNLLMMLAETAARDGAFVSRRDIEKRLWAGPVSKKAVADAANKLKRELVTKGAAEAAVRCLIENNRSIGYRLAITSSEILISD
jgi:DNA-binding winged helix-turn-helix (wHTH) protein